jgi:hypothetical protein
MGVIRLAAQHSVLLMCGILRHASRKQFPCLSLFPLGRGSPVRPSAILGDSLRVVHPTGTSRKPFGGCRKETVKKQWQSKSRNPVSIGDNSQGNGTAGKVPISQ